MQLRAGVISKPAKPVLILQITKVVAYIVACAIAFGLCVVVVVMFGFGW